MKTTHLCSFSIFTVYQKREQESEFTEPTFICSESTMETPDKYLKHVQS